MKKLFAILSVLICSTSYGQIVLKTVGGATQTALQDTAAAIRADFPAGGGGVTQATLDDSTAAIRADFPSAIDTIPIHNQLTQLYAGVALKLNITDTSILHAQLVQLYAGVALKKNNSDSVGISGYATNYSRNKARDSVQTNVNTINTSIQYINVTSNTTAINQNASAAGPGSTAIGYNSLITNTETHAIAMGYLAQANVTPTVGSSGGGQVAIGDSTIAGSWRATALGGRAQVKQVSGTAVGYGSYSNAPHGFVLGRGAFSDKGSTMTFYNGNGVTAGNTSFYFGGVGSAWTNPAMPGGEVIDGSSALNAGTVYSALRGISGRDANTSPTLTNVKGGNIKLMGGTSTGTAAGGDVELGITLPGGSSNNTENTDSVRLTLKGDIGNIGIGTRTPDASAILEVKSTVRGVLFPRLNTTQMSAISSPATGLMIFNTDTLSLFQWTGATWQNVHSSSGGGGSGISTLNTLSGSVQTFATGTSGSDFGISSSGTTHTFNIPDASGANRGLVTTGTQTIAGTKTFTSNLTYGGAVQSSSGATLSNLYVTGAASVVNGFTNSFYEINSNPSAFRVAFRGGTASVVTAGNDAWGVLVGDNKYTEATSGTSALGGGLAVVTQTFTNGSGATTDFQNVYIGDAPSSTATNNWALNTGATKFRENVTVALGKSLLFPEGTDGRVGQTTLVSGTKAITISGLTTSSRAIVTFVSSGGTVTTTWQYAAVCTSNTLTITALTNAGATDTSDTSVLNYFIVN